MLGTGGNLAAYGTSWPAPSARVPLGPLFIPGSDCFFSGSSFSSVDDAVALWWPMTSTAGDIPSEAGQDILPNSMLATPKRTAVKDSGLSNGILFLS